MNFRYIFLFACLGLSTTVAAKDVVWYSGGHVTYSTQKNYGTVVAKALDMFSSDMKAVTGKSAHKGTGKIEIYQLDMLTNKEFKALSAYKLPIEKIIAKPDAFWMGTRRGKVVIVGSNGRGTAYGILELSRKAGVSPWIDWGDVTPLRKNYLALDDKFEILQRPSVDYRGVFINDEDWSSRVWDKQLVDRHSKTGVIGPRYYHRLFQLLLRLRANTLWPAMHEGTKGFFQVKGNREVADSFDIVVGSSHCEPLLRNNVAEWDSKTMGHYNWVTNRKQVEQYWRERVQETAHMDALYTLGMRGIHDGAMEGVGSGAAQVSALQSVIDEQRKILRQTVNHDLKKVPQVFIPYKEVLHAYESGLKVPDDVTLMWCDDNYGYLTRLPDAAEQRRSGGGGVYYHLSYWGRPHDYLWLTTTQPGLVYSEMRQAWDHHARRLWIANVHDPKVAAYDLSLFMDMAWDIQSVTATSLQQHLRQWLTQQFGEEAGAQLVGPMTEFYRLCGVRRPEFMGWSQVELDWSRYKNGLSPVQDTEFSADEFGNELERYLNDYDNIKEQVEAAEHLIRPELKDAFFAAVKYPVFCAAAMATKQLQAQEARHIARKENFHKDDEALEAAVRSVKAYQEIQKLTETYNKQLAHSKWDGLMDMAPRGLPVFQAPSLPDQVTAEEMSKYVQDPIVAKMEQDGCVVRNACDYQSANGGAQPVEMLGHSMKAVQLPKGGSLTYSFYAKPGAAVLYTALIPTQANDKGDIRYSVSVDGGEPVVYSLKEPFRSERWKVNVLRGQALRSTPITLEGGNHTLVITALDDHIVVDQWMIDYNPDRSFYMFPVKPAM